MRVLVTAATRHGSTQMIANEIVRGLRDRGIHADFVVPDEVGSVQDYDAVVIGSAVYTGHWMKPATTFVHTHERELVDRPVWLFSSGPVGAPPVPGTETVDTEVIATATRALGHRSFAGSLDRALLGLAERAMVSLVHAQDGDFRDWDAVQEWTKSIAETLLASSAQAVLSGRVRARNVLGTGRSADQGDEPMLAPIPGS
jgi:menaquinone-dependent protoporphyrinogen oxidase